MIIGINVFPDKASKVVLKVSDYLSRRNSRLKKSISQTTDALLRSVGFKMISKDIVEICLPEGMTTHEFGCLANRECVLSGIAHPAFYSGQYSRWESIDTKEGQRIVPGRVYQIKIIEDLVSESRSTQQRMLYKMGGYFCPPGAVAIAAMCIHLNTFGEMNFLKELWVRTTTPGYALRRDSLGILLDYYNDDCASLKVGCAAFIESTALKVA